MRKLNFLIVILITTAIFFTACAAQSDVKEKSNPVAKGSAEPAITPTPQIPAQKSEKPEERQELVPDGEGTLYFTVMVHLEGWRDDTDEDSFRGHAELVRQYANLFEKYGAKLTLESKEFTAGCIKWGDNVLLEMEKRGHGIGLHADIGGSKKETQNEIETGIQQMKDELESLDVTVRHVSGVCSDKDWVEACIKAGFEATTGTVSYALWSLKEENRPEGFEPYANPGEGHSVYPWEISKTIYPWKTSDCSNWIVHNEEGKLIIFPSGIGLAFAYEEFTGESFVAGTHNFTVDDLEIWKATLDEILTYTDSNHVNTYYAAWSLGKSVPVEIFEEWLKLIDEYVKEGRIIWATVPEMIDLYNAK